MEAEASLKQLKGFAPRHGGALEGGFDLSMKPTASKGGRSSASSPSVDKLWFELLMKRGMLHSRTRNYPDAIEDYSSAMKRGGVCVRGLLHRGIALHESQCRGTALSDYDMVLELEPGHVVALNCKGRLLMELGKLQAAIECFEGLPKDQTGCDTLLSLAACHTR